MIRDHKPKVSPCECSKCHALTASAPPDHPHRHCSHKAEGRGTWRKITADDLAEKLAGQATAG